MQPPLPSPTPTWRNDTYPAISPSRPELTAKGKTVIITGAGSGIGRETAIAFATAGAARLVLLGRTKATLDETASLLPSHVSKEVFAVDVTQEDAIQRVATAVGTWDVLILGAGFVADRGPLASSSTDSWWQSFETNVKAPLIAIKAFTPTKSTSRATILAVTSGVTTLPPPMLAGLSSYISSKLALTKMVEFLAAEQPDIFAATVHPGMVETAVFLKTGAKAETLPMDKVQLPAHFMVWMCSPEASFLNGRIAWANWDVDELKGQAEAIKSGMQFTSGIHGWPFGSS
ncbi:putative NADP(+)-dependent dehydrogenase [Hypoxylon sp. FL1284]|nr:putative NADP(+)-dependent dehydrogenase [Hypoxylon sp. FL1284]